MNFNNEKSIFCRKGENKHVGTMRGVWRKPTQECSTERTPHYRPQTRMKREHSREKVKFSYRNL